MQMKEHRWMSYEAARAYEKEASLEGVSKVARGPGGFMRVYEKMRTPQKMRRAQVKGGSEGYTWAMKRHGFIQRHLKQYRKNPTYRRKLALIMWAYMPS